MSDSREVGGRLSVTALIGARLGSSPGLASRSAASASALTGLLTAVLTALLGPTGGTVLYAASLAMLASAALLLKLDDRGRTLFVVGTILHLAGVAYAYVFDGSVSAGLMVLSLLAVLTSAVLGEYDMKQHFSLPPHRKLLSGRASSLLTSAAYHVFLAAAVMVTAFPIVWVLAISVTPGNTLINTELKLWPEEITWEHYHQVLFEENFTMYFVNSLIVSVGTTVVGIFLASTAAYALSRYDFFGKAAVLKSFLLVQMFPGVIIIVPYFIILKYYGLLNSFLGLIAAYSVTALPLCLYMIKGFFDTIPRDIEEAAMVDGASPGTIFVRIILPLAKPAIAVTALFSFLAAWNEYLLAYTFMLDDSYYTLPVKIYSYVRGNNQLWGTFAAMSIVVSIPVVILFMAFQKYLISGMTAGGVKG